MRQVLSIFLILVLFTAFTVLGQDGNSGFTLPIAEDVIYTVRPADTLDGIGAIFDVSPSCIADVNDIQDVRAIRPRDELLISVNCPLYGDDARDNVFMEALVPREVVTYEDDCEGYRVHRNDSIDMIGFVHNVSTAAIAVENELEPPYVLQINQCLIIPDDAPPWGQYPPLQTVAGEKVNADSLEGEYYVIQPLEPLDTVAAMHDVSVVALVLANNIKDTKTLQPGTVIFVPDNAPPYGAYPAIEAPISGQIYLVGEDDTLDSIAQFFDKAVIAIQVANGIETDDDLVVGETILIPYNGPVYGDDASFDPSMLLGQGSGGETHIVQPLETIDQISASYNVDTTCILLANNVRYPYLVKPGRVLVIDPNCPAYSGYVRAPLADVVVPADSVTGDPMPPEATEEPAMEAPAQATEAAPAEMTEEPVAEATEDVSE